MNAAHGLRIDGGVALLLSFFICFVMPFLYSGEVGGLHARAGRQKPVSGATGLRAIPGFLVIVGAFVWISRPMAP